MLTGLFGYLSQASDVCQSWSHGASMGADITPLHKFAQASGIIACLFGFTATLLLFLSFFIRSLLTKCTWRIAIPTLIITAGVFQLCTFALADNCKCPQGYSGCVVTCTLQDGGIRSVAASALYLLIGISIIFYPRRTTPLIGFVYAPLESNKTCADVESQTMTNETPLVLREEEPFFSNGCSSLPQGRAITSHEQFVADWEGLNNAGADVEASNTTRDALAMPRVEEPILLTTEDSREPLRLAQDGAIYTEEQFAASWKDTSKSRDVLEVPSMTRDAPDVPRVKEPFVSKNVQGHELPSMPQGHPISSQEQTMPNREDMNESSFLPHEQAREPSNAQYRHGQRPRNSSKGHHHRRRETSREKLPSEAEGQGLWDVDA